MSRTWFKFNLSYPLTVLGASLALILGTSALCQLYTYFRLTAHVEASACSWKVVKKSSSSYPIQCQYHFEFKGKNYQGTSLLRPPYHLNRSSAEKALPKMETRKIWIDPHQPAVSSLEKELPLKKIVYALLSLGTTVYFWLIETTTAKTQKNYDEKKPST